MKSGFSKLLVLFAAIALISWIVFTNRAPMIDYKLMAQNSQILQQAIKEDSSMSDKISKSDREWQEILTPLQFDITRKKGTERAFTGEYYNFEGSGIYKCVCCGNPLFDSEAKYHSGSGWPSFWTTISEINVKVCSDFSLGMSRSEVTCARCGAHLGHVFGDGPEPTGLRYCINSAALKFKEGEDGDKEVMDK